MVSIARLKIWNNLYHMKVLLNSFLDMVTLSTSSKERAKREKYNNHHAWKLLFTHRSLKASFFKSEKSGIEFLNSFIFSSRTWQSGKALTSRGSLLSCLMKPSIPSDNTDTSRLAQSVLAHSSRAACWRRSKSTLLKFSQIKFLHNLIYIIFF